MLDLQCRQRDGSDQQGLCGSSHSRGQARPGRVWPDLQQGETVRLRGCAMCPPRILTAAAGSISGGRGVVQLPQRSYCSLYPPGYSAGEGRQDRKAHEHSGTLFVVPREGGGGAGGSDIRELHKKQTSSSTVQTEQEFLSQHGPASAPKSTGRCHGAGEQQQQHRVHRFPLPGEQICWHSQGKDRAAPADPCAR